MVGSTIGDQSASSTDKHWASGYIAKALEKGIIKEGELEKNGQTKNTAGLKAWDWQISRDYMAVIIARTLENVLKEDLTVKNQVEVENSILDYPGLCDYCKQYIVAVYSKGIVTGYPNNEFMGWKRATRAEAATMLVRMIEPSSRAAVKILDVVKVGDPKEFVKGKWLNSDILAGAVKYTVLPSAEPYKLALGERNGTKWIESEGLHLLLLMKDGELIEALQTGDVGFYKSDITTIDYIVSASSTTKAIILIPNPFKK